MTTAIATFVRYGAELSLEVRFKDIRSISMFGLTAKEQSQAIHESEILPNNLEVDQSYLWKVSTADEPIEFAGKSGSLRDLIPRLTATNHMAQYIASISTTHPADFLKSGIVIIDTPGANASDETHKEITRAAVERADAALIITPAEQAVSQWLKETLGRPDFLLPLLHRCVFMITRMDLARARMRRTAREEAIAIIRDDAVSRLKEGLASIAFPQEPVVYLSAAQAIIDELDTEEEIGIPNLEERTYWQQEFLQFQKDFGDHMIYQRAETIAESVLRLLEKIFVATEQHFSYLWEDYRRRSNQLQHITQDIGSFCETQQSKWIKLIKNSTQHIINDTQRKMGRDRDRQMDEISDLFFSTSSMEELREVVNDDLPKELKKSGKNAENYIRKQCRKISNTGLDFNESFEEEFQDLYQKLQLLGSAKSVGRARDLSLQTRDQSLSFSSSKALEDTTVEDAIGGAILGGVIGSIIPGIGTIFGAMVGGFLSSVWGKSIDDKKAVIWEDLEPKLLDYHYDLYHDAEHLLKKHGKATRKSIQDRIDQHAKKYRSEVRQMREAQAQEKLDLEKLKDSLMKDLKDLKQRRQEVQDQQVYLRQQVKNPST